MCCYRTGFSDLPKNVAGQAVRQEETAGSPVQPPHLVQIDAVIRMRVGK